MKVLSKAKILFLIVPIFALGGAFLLQKLDTEKPLEYEKLSLSGQDTTNNGRLMDFQKSQINSVESAPKLLLSNRKTTNNTSSTHNHDPKVTSTALTDKTFPQVPSFSTTTQTLQAAEKNFSDDTMDFSLDDLPLPFFSSLPMQEDEKAIASFESQHDTWLAIESGTARYKTKLRRIKEGKFVGETMVPQTGTLEFTVTPLSSPIKRQSPAKVQFRLFNDDNKKNYLKNNVFDSESPSWEWAEDSTSSVESRKAKHVNALFNTDELLFLPLDFMAKTYSEGKWNNKYTKPKEDYFENQRIIRRGSTPEETDNIFDGEPQYLFLDSPAIVDAHYWFSAKTGDLRQIDIFSPKENVVRSFRYENYIQKEGNNTKFPQRFTLTWKKGSGDEVLGWEYTIELSDVELNVDIPPERFTPPSMVY